jgi:hypothetical protein
MGGAMILTGESLSTRRKNLSQCNFVHHKSHMGQASDRTYLYCYRFTDIFCVTNLTFAMKVHGL